MIKSTADFGELLENLKKKDCTNSIPKETMLTQVEKLCERDGATDELVEVLKDKLTCAICLEVTMSPVTARCKHIFCYSCILIWWQDNNNCPLCRTTLACLRVLTKLDAVVCSVMSKIDEDYAHDTKEDEITYFKSTSLRMD